MRQQIDVERLGTSPNHDASDWQRLLDWITRIAHRNEFDPAIFDYPATFTLKAQRGDEATLYMPVQTCYVYESLAIGPDNSAADTAESLKAMFAVLHADAVARGQGESYFLCSDAETCTFAEHQGLGKVTGGETLQRLVLAAANVLKSQNAEPIEHAQAMGELDIALNEYKKHPGMNLYRKRHIRAKAKMGSERLEEASVHAQ